jgi:hypothetical protein
VVFDVRLRTHEVCEFLLWPRGDGLVDLEFRDARLARSRDVMRSGVLVVGGHGKSFRRPH